MPQALVTGATGFLGGAILRELLAREWNVRAIHRPGSDLRYLDGHASTVEKYVGDLREPESLKPALEGCDVLFHVAARYQFGLIRARDLFQDNVVGTRNIIAAARECNVKRMVYTSTAGVLRPRSDGVLADENDLATLGQLHGAYKRTKWLADQEVVKAAKEGLPVVIVCPTAPVGPFDVKPTPTGKMILDFLLGRMRGYVDTGLNLVACEDVAVGHVLAAEKGEVGRRYILGSENLSLMKIFETLSRITGLPAPRFRLPKSLLLPLSLLSEGISMITRRSPLFSLETARMARKHMYFDSSRAVRELGFSPGSVEDALERAVVWFRDNHYLPPGKVFARSPGPSRGESLKTS